MNLIESAVVLILVREQSEFDNLNPLSIGQMVSY